MQRLQFVLLQIDEASRYLADGRVAHLRLALLLLDNAIEILLDDRARLELAEEEPLEGLRFAASNSPVGHTLKGNDRIMSFVPLTPKEKYDIRRYFDPRVDYLCGRRNILDSRVAGVLKYLHRYRNEAYHRATVRIGTIATAVTLQIEIVCRLLISLPKAIVVSSIEDYTWFEERYEMRPSDTWDVEARTKIAHHYLEKHQLDPAAISQTLHQHLNERILDLYDSLDYVNSVKPNKSDRETVLKECQYFAELSSGNISPAKTQLSTYSPVYSLKTIETINDESSSILQAEDSLDAFKLFMALEELLEFVEAPVVSAVIGADMYIDQQMHG